MRNSTKTIRNLPNEDEEAETMNNTAWFVIATVVWAAGFGGGYALSARTGTEPGYFDAVEAAGYGGGGDAKIEGISDEMSDYYKSLLSDDE